MKRIFCILETCVGCRTCELSCAVSHSKSKDLNKAVQEESRPKQRIFVQGSRQGPYPLQCRHCNEPACVLACMSAAITRDPVTGTVAVDKDRCVGCGMCIMSCPYGALIMDKDTSVSTKCDLCAETGEPACVAACPTGSLLYVTYQEYLEKRKEKQKTITQGQR